MCSHVNSVGKVISKLMSDAGYSGFFSGHSLRRTGGSRLFQAGVQRKLVKECTGHSSDAVNTYQITSDDQRATISEIIQSDPKVACKGTSGDVTAVAGTATDPQIQKSNANKTPNLKEKCSCESQGYGGLIEQLISHVNATGKAKIKIEIEITKE